MSSIRECNVGISTSCVCARLPSRPPNWRRWLGFRACGGYWYGWLHSLKFSWLNDSTWETCPKMSRRRYMSKIVRAGRVLSCHIGAAIDRCGKWRRFDPYRWGWLGFLDLHRLCESNVAVICGSNPRDQIIYKYELGGSIMWNLRLANIAQDSGARLRIEMSGDQKPTIVSLRIKVYLTVGVTANPNELQRTIIQLSNINTNLRSGNKNDN